MPEIDPSRLPKTKLPPIAQALIIRRLREKPDGRRVSGAELVTIRRAVLGGVYDGLIRPGEYRGERTRLLAISKDSMPPVSDDVWLLIETLSQRLGAVGHGAAWDSIGIKGTRGRDMLARSASSVNWPIWSTLLHAALD